MIKKKSTFLFPQLIANAYKTTRFIAGFVYNLSDLTCDEIQQLQCKCKLMLFLRTTIIVTVYQ